MRKFYYERLDEENQKFYKEIVKGLENGWHRITLYGLTDQEQFVKCIDAVEEDLPYLFFVDHCKTRYYIHSDYIEYVPKYLYEGQALLDKQRELEEIVQRILNSMPMEKLNTVSAKCLWLHNYLVRNCVYDHEAYNDDSITGSPYSIEGVFFKQKAVCQGIALAYRYLCERVNVEAIVASGYSFEPGKKESVLHAWNIVRVGEESIQVDVTWDMCLSPKNRPIRYDYFFLPDVDMIQDHTYVDYPVCRNRNINLFQYTHTSFETVDELKSYVDTLEKEIEKKDVYVYFKMKKWEESDRELAKIVARYIMRKWKKNLAYTYSRNETQSIYLFHYYI